MAENSAVLACIAALTEWFETGDADFNSHLAGQDLGKVIEFLFGALIVAIDDLCADGDPAVDRLARLAFEVTSDDYG